MSLTTCVCGKEYERHEILCAEPSDTPRTEAGRAYFFHLCGRDCQDACVLDDIRHAGWLARIPDPATPPSTEGLERPVDKDQAALVLAGAMQEAGFPYDLTTAGTILDYLGAPDEGWETLPGWGLARLRSTQDET
jgi:hypothetical protein